MKAKLWLIVSSILLMGFLMIYSSKPQTFNEDVITEHSELNPVHKIIYDAGYQLLKTSIQGNTLVFEIVGESNAFLLNELSTNIYLFKYQEGTDPAIRLMLINPNDHEQVLLIMENGKVTWDISTNIQEKKRL